MNPDTGTFDVTDVFSVPHVLDNESGKWPWLQTFTGKPFVVADPDPELVDIRDIAIGLSREARYNGHTLTSEPYSVAQHSVLVSLVVPLKTALWGLLHDASESYCKDLTWSVKTLLPEYKEIENRVLQAIAERFELPWPPPPEIKEADTRMLATEKRDLMGEPPAAWRDLPEPYPFKIRAVDHRTAAVSFLKRFNNLTGRHVPIDSVIWPPNSREAL